MALTQGTDEAGWQTRLTKLQAVFASEMRPDTNAVRFDSLHELSVALVQTEDKKMLAGFQKKLEDILLPAARQGLPPHVCRILGVALCRAYAAGNPSALYPAFQGLMAHLKTGGGKSGLPAPVRLAIIDIMGILFETHGRLIMPNAVDAVGLLGKQIKHGEVAIKVAALESLSKIVKGCGSGGNFIHTDVLKMCKRAAEDKTTAVREGAALCLRTWVDNATSLTSDFDLLESMVTYCAKGVDDAAAKPRTEFARCLGALLALAVSPYAVQSASKNKDTPKKSTLEDTFAFKGRRKVYLVERGFEGVYGLMSSYFQKAGSKEMRSAIAYAYVEFLQNLDEDVVEKNILGGALVSSILNMLAVGSSKTMSTEVDMHHAQLCVSNIFRVGIRRLLGERGLTTLGRALSDFISSKEAAEHSIICALREMAQVFNLLGESCSQLKENVQQKLLYLLTTPSSNIRLAAASAFCAMATTNPGTLATQMSECLDMVMTDHAELAQAKQRPQQQQYVICLHGHSQALASLIAAIPQCPLGVPHSLPTTVVQAASSLLNAQEQTSMGVALARSEAGWVLITALVAHGPNYCEANLSRLFRLWKASLGRRTAESIPQQEPAIILELKVRTGALNALHSFVKNNSTLLSSMLLKPIVHFLSNTLSLLSALLSNTKTMLSPKAVTTILVLKAILFETFAVLPPMSFSTRFVPLLQMAVADIIGSSDSVITSHLLGALESSDSVAMMQSSGEEAGDDVFGLVEELFTQRGSKDAWDSFDKKMHSPQPAVRVVDAAITLFANIFSAQTEHNRQHLLEHFLSSLKSWQGKPVTRAKLSAHTNISAAMLSSLRLLSEKKATMGEGKVVSNAWDILLVGLHDSDPLLRRATAEGIGLLARVAGDSFTGNVVRTIEKQVKSRETFARAGLAFALGSIHRSIGMLPSIPLLPASVRTLQVLARDGSAPVHISALHSLWLIIEATSLNFAPHVRSTLVCIYTLLMSENILTIESLQSIGRIVGGIIGSLGPELEVGSEGMLRCISVVSELQAHPSPKVQMEAVVCMQQLINFAPHLLQSLSFLPYLQEQLKNGFAPLRKVTVEAIRALAKSKAGVASANNLESTLFDMLDTEQDAEVLTEIKKTITTLVEMSAPIRCTMWIRICKRVLHSSKSSDEQSDEVAKMKRKLNLLAEASAAEAAGDRNDDRDDNDGHSDDDDGGDGFGGGGDMGGRKSKADDVVLAEEQPKWETKVFAAEVFRQVLAETDRSNHCHFDLEEAREKLRKDLTSMSMAERDAYQGNLLVLHLGDLIQIAFASATSNFEMVRPIGIHALQDVVELFGKAADPDFEDHMLLELYEAQIAAALRPAFSADAPPPLTAAACSLVAMYVRSDVASDAGVLKRVVSLLTGPLETVRDMYYPSYNEHAATMKQLAILKALAELQLAARNKEEMVLLLKPYQTMLRENWMAVLRDFSVLATQRKSMKKAYAGVFFIFPCAAAVEPYYKAAWPSILKATATQVDSDMWLQDRKSKATVADDGNDGGGSEEGTTPVTPQTPGTLAGMGPDGHLKDFKVLVGMCIRALCLYGEDEELVISSLDSLRMLLVKRYLVPDSFAVSMCDELMLVLQELAETADVAAHRAVVQVLRHLTLSLTEDYFASSDDPKNPSFFLLQTAVECAIKPMYRYLPGLHDDSALKPGVTIGESLTKEHVVLVKASLSNLSRTMSLCPAAATMLYLPTVLSMLVKLLAHSSQDLLPSSLNTLRELCALTVKNCNADVTIRQKVGVMTAGAMSQLIDFIGLLDADDNSHFDNLVNGWAVMLPMLGGECGDLQIRSYEVMRGALDMKSPARAGAVLQAIGVLCDKPATEPAQYSVPSTETLKLVLPDVAALISDATQPGTTESDAVLVVGEGLKMLVKAHAMVATASSDTTVLAILLVVLCNLGAPSSHNGLMALAVKFMVFAGNAFSPAFRDLIQQLPTAMRTQLENAVRTQSQAPAAAAVPAATRPAGGGVAAPAAAPVASKPSIALKMDFSNFKK